MKLANVFDVAEDNKVDVESTSSTCASEFVYELTASSQTFRPNLISFHLHSHPDLWTESDIISFAFAHTINNLEVHSDWSLVL